MGTNTANLELSGPFLMAYTVGWVLFCILALGILLKERKQVSSEWRIYFRFLCVPWKLAIFVPAFLFVTFAGRFTDDETWDVVTGGVMSVLTFLTAPWSLGVLYKVLTGKRSPKYLLVAIAFCLFSCSWFYDSYLFLRDGHYTSRWLGNLMLSPVIYSAGGLLWNLEAKGVWPSWSFLRSDWPEPPVDQSFRCLFLIALPLIATAGAMLVGYVRWHF